jgi:hypothetical protein
MDNSITSHQEYAIKIISQNSDFRFIGTTRREAIKFIGDHYALYKECKERIAEGYDMDEGLNEYFEPLFDITGSCGENY